MIEYGLIGYPLGHSASAEYFNDKFYRLGIAARYTAYPIERIEEFPELLRDRSLSLRGLNVTYPYKEAVITYLDEMDPLAEEVGAVNTISIDTQRNSRPYLKGYNTDVVGFKHSIASHLGERRRALILGSGGAAKAVRKALDLLGIPSVTLSRKAEKPNTCSYDAFGSETLRDYPIIINATPLGMAPLVTEYPPIDYTQIDIRHLCYDLIYNPSKTLFLQKAEERGATCINGMEMLLAQAEAAYRIWQGMPPCE